MDYQFTAHMEEELDDIAEGKLEWQPMLDEFYKPFEQQLQIARDNMPQVQQEEPIGRDCPNCGGIKHWSFAMDVSASSSAVPIIQNVAIPSRCWNALVFPARFAASNRRRDRRSQVAQRSHILWLHPLS